MSCCLYHERWCTYIVQTGEWAHTPKEQWSGEGSSVGVSSFCPLYQGRPQGYRPAAGPLLVSDGFRTHKRSFIFEEHFQTAFYYFTETLSFLHCTLYLSTVTQTFRTLRTLQLHGFLLHFLLSTGFKELNRMWLVDSEKGRSDLYSDSETDNRTNTHTYFMVPIMQKNPGVY